MSYDQAYATALKEIDSLKARVAEYEAEMERGK